MKEIILPFTADTGGDATVSGKYAILGKLYAIEYQPGTAATGADLTLTINGPAASSKPILTKANAGTSNVWYYPRDLVNKVEDGAALTGTSGGDRACPVVQGVPYLVVAQAGNGGAGTVIIYYEDGMKDVYLALATHASLGTASTSATTAVFGKLYAVEYQPGTIDTGATLTLTCVGPAGSSKALLTKASAGTANVRYYPRDLVQAVTDGSDLTGTSGGDRACPILQGRPLAAIASGGNSKAGAVILYYEE